MDQGEKGIVYLKSTSVDAGKEGGQQACIAVSNIYSGGRRAGGRGSAGMHFVHHLQRGGGGRKGRGSAFIHYVEHLQRWTKGGGKRVSRHALLIASTAVDEGRGECRHRFFCVVTAQVTNVNTDLGWGSYLGKGALYANFSITSPGLTMLLVNISLPCLLP